MLRYVFKRVLMLIPVILGVSLLVFVLLDLAPGTVIDVIAGDYTQEELEALEKELGYDRSVFYRYGKYMLNLLRGDLGTSYIYKMKVWDLYIQRLPATMVLAGASVLLSIVLSLPLGILAARKRGTLVDNSITVVALLGQAMPNVWQGLMTMVIFSLYLKWLPSAGFDSPLAIIMPALTIGTGLMATLTRTTRSSMLDVIRSDYLRTARAKGVPEKKVIGKHALKNALIPIITVIGTQLGNTLGGSVVTENLFSWPGVGRLTIDAVKSRDATTVTGCIIMSVVMISVLQLIVDLTYALVDPRLRAQYSSGGKKKKKTEKEGAEA